MSSQRVREMMGGSSLLDWALMAHGMTTGACDFCPADMRLAQTILSAALEDWGPSCRGSEDFDNAVKRLLQVALCECASAIRDHDAAVIRTRQ